MILLTDLGFPTGSYTWALLYFVGSAIIMGVSVLTLNYNKRLPV